MHLIPPSQLVLLLVLLLCRAPLCEQAGIPNPLICEDEINNQPPFNAEDTVCILGCGVPVSHATGSLLPGSVNETAIPYCLLNCVHSDATPAQSSAAPGCHAACQVKNEISPENVGWCMYWCVDGYKSLVLSTSCVPMYQMFVTGTATEGGRTLSGEVLSEPGAWVSWYRTQTITTDSNYAAPTTSGPSMPGPTGITPDTAPTRPPASTQGASETASTSTSSPSLLPSPSATKSSARQLSLDWPLLVVAACLSTLS